MKLDRDSFVMDGNRHHYVMDLSSISGHATISFYGDKACFEEAYLY